MPRADLETVLAKERELMNSYAPFYQVSNFFNSYVYREERRKFTDWIVRTLRHAGREPASLSILEVGAGTGDTLELLAGSGCRRLAALDIADEMLAQLRQRIPLARCLHGSIERYDFGSERFDVILATFTLHHMHDPRAFFDLVDHVLAPGGWFFIGEYNAGGWGNSRWSKPMIGTGISPFRRLMKWKNRRILSGQPKIPLLFNPAHRVLSYHDIVGSMSNPDAYALQRRTRGLFLPAFNYALVEDSGLDRLLYRFLERLDFVAGYFGKGFFQWIAGRRSTEIS